MKEQANLVAVAGKLIVVEGYHRPTSFGHLLAEPPDEGCLRNERRQD